MLMSGEGSDEKKANALKTSLDYLDGFLARQNFVAGNELTIADFSILASITQLEAMDFKITGYRWVEMLLKDRPSDLTSILTFFHPFLNRGGCVKNTFNFSRFFQAFIGVGEPFEKGPPVL